MSTWCQNCFRRQHGDSYFCVMLILVFGLSALAVRKYCSCWNHFEHTFSKRRNPTGPGGEPWCFESICRLPTTPHRLGFPSFAPHKRHRSRMWLSAPERSRGSVPAGCADAALLPRAEPRAGSGPRAEPRCWSRRAVGASAGVPGPCPARPSQPLAAAPPPSPGSAARAYSGGTALPLAPGAAGSRRDARPAELSALGAAGPGAARPGAARRAAGAAAARRGPRRCRAGARGRCALGGAGAEHGAALLRRGRPLPLCECGAPFSCRRVGTAPGNSSGSFGGVRGAACGFRVGCVSAEVRGWSKELSCSSCVQSSIETVLIPFSHCGRGRFFEVHSWETMQQIVGV